MGIHETIADRLRRADAHKAIDHANALIDWFLDNSDAIVGEANRAQIQDALNRIRNAAEDIVNGE